jgi:hypothetical protein
VLCGFFDEAESILRSVRGEKEKDPDRDTKSKGWCGKWLGGNKEGECAVVADSATAVEYRSWILGLLCSVLQRRMSILKQRYSSCCCCQHANRTEHNCLSVLLAIGSIDS